MASIIRIKRSSVSGNPTTLAAGELAYSALTDNGSNGGDRLYIGSGTETNGNAANHFVIGGKFFTDRLDHTAGVLTADSALVVDSNKKLDELLVDNLSLNGNTLSTTTANGDLYLTPSGSGKTVITNPYIGDTSTSLAEYIQDVAGAGIISGDGVDVSYNDTTGQSTVSLNVEYAQDLVGAMISGTGATQSGISVGYDDANGKLTFNVNDPVLTIAGDADGSATMTDLGNTTINITLDTVNSNVGTYGSATAIPVITVNGKGLVTGVSTASVASTLNIAGDTGTDGIALLSETLSVVGGEGIDTAVTANTITISGEDATTTNKGIASFDTNNFTVTSGAVSTKSITLGSSTLTNGSTTSSLAGLTQLTVDNIDINGNTISSTDTNGNIILDTNGTGVIDVSATRITNLAEPTADTDAATKYYVDAARSGLDVKASVKAATTGSITLSNTQTIDGVALSVGDRVLVKDQSTKSQNGIYVVASGSWARSSDADNTPAGEVTSGMFTFVEQGTVNANCGFVLTTADPITLGTTDLDFTLFSSSGTLIAGNGLSKNGYTLEVNVAATGGIEISADNLQLKSSVAGNGLTLTSGVLDIVGTSNRIAVNADSIDIASTYVGQTSITTLGAVTTGTWSADTITTTKGGTGLTSYATGDLLYASGANTLAKLSAGADGKVLQMNASGVPVWGDIDGGTY